MKKSKFRFEENKEILFLTIRQKNDKIEFVINCQSTFPNPYYYKEFTLNELQKISKFFNLFDSIEECFADLKQKFEYNNYEINLDHYNEKIIIKIITNIAKKDFYIDIPVKKFEQEKTYSKFIYHYSIKSMSKFEKKNYSKIEELENKFEYFENILNLKAIEDKRHNLFEKSTIIKNDFERKLLESFIKDNDNTKKEIFPVLLFKASINGDNSQDFHKKCDYMGATLTIVESETGRRFGGYTSISWDKNLGNYNSKGVNFLFSLDTRIFYKNVSGNHTYHNNSYGPTFGGGHDLYISSGCLNNQNSYSSKSNYDMSCSYELNGGVQKFKVLDYEVFQI